MADSLQAARDEQAPEERKLTVIEQGGRLIAQNYDVIRFRGRPMVMVHTPLPHPADPTNENITIPYPHFVPLTREGFREIAYPLLGGVTRSRVGDIYDWLTNTQPDLTNNDDYILFGLTEVGPEGQPLNLDPTGTTFVWDMEDLRIVTSGANPNNCVWRSPYAGVRLTDPETNERKKIPFILSLAGGDEAIYDDIMQSLAPLIMKRKPDGVIWWVGSGANGKSTLMDAIHKIFPGQLASLTVGALTAERDTPHLNGHLANVVRESSEGRIEDTQVYKSIGTHENFSVHEMYKQDTVTIRGNLHHIFSANTIPVFNDKGHAARRRTFIIPFREQFKSDPDFERRTFTPEFFGQLILEMTRYAGEIARRGYTYKWSGVTDAAKVDYDAEANTAEEFARHLKKEGVVAFDSFAPVRVEYENWCADNAYVVLGVGHMRRAIQAVGFERLSWHDGTTVKKHYRVPEVGVQDLQPYGMGRPGMYTVKGFKPPIVDDPEPVIPEFKPEAEPEPVTVPEPPHKLRGLGWDK